MAKGLNKCMFIGNVCADPESRFLTNGDAVVTFSLAVNDDYKDKQGNKVEQCEFVRVVAFRRLAEIIGEYAGKGKKIYIEGKQRTRTWEDKDGQKRYTTEIVASDMLLIDGNRNDNQEPQSSPAARYEPQTPPTRGPTGSDFEDDQIQF